MEQSSLQQANRLARFEAKSEASAQYIPKQPSDASTMPEAKAAPDSFYDPNHPDADWAGLVKKDRGGRQRVAGQSAQASHLAFGAGGIQSADAALEADPLGLDSRKQPLRSGTREDGVRIAGPEGDHSDHWTTNAQAMMKGEATDPSLYTQNHQSLTHGGGKKVLTPAYENAGRGGGGGAAGGGLARPGARGRPLRAGLRRRRGAIVRPDRGGVGGGGRLGPRPERTGR
mmetsp:Transcript_29363/g.50733  ORF Transcript_29363/g.50733 Transcript_29363/m.50733 type:complete len:229 (+) Transcript_29363:46-732(+)